MPNVFRINDSNGNLHTVAFQANVSNASGAASTPVTTPVSFTGLYGAPLLPGNGYAVNVTPSQACFVSVTGKTSSGFNVVLTPLSGQSIAAGTFSVSVHG
jgi:hypothetical protein